MSEENKQLKQEMRQKIKYLATSKWHTIEAERISDEIEALIDKAVEMGKEEERERVDKLTERYFGGIKEGTAITKTKMNTNKITRT